MICSCWESPAVDAVMETMISFSRVAAGEFSCWWCMNLFHLLFLLKGFYFAHVFGWLLWWCYIYPCLFGVLFDVCTFSSTSVAVNLVATDLKIVASWVSCSFFVSQIFVGVSFWMTHASLFTMAANASAFDTVGTLMYWCLKTTPVCHLCASHTPVLQEHRKCLVHPW